MQKLIVLTVTVMTLAAGAASAQDGRVRFGDLDLATPEDAARFDRRVERAARSACGGTSALAAATCAARFRAEAQALLPAARREEYSRGRTTRQLAMIPVHYG